MSKKVKVEEKKSIGKYFVLIGVILFLVAVFTPILAKNLKFGLDLKGGFEVLYQVKSIDGDKVTSDMVTSTYKTIIKRIDVLGVSEPVVQIEGEDKIRVQLAGVTNPEEARTTLSQVANLSFRDTDDNLLMTSEVLKGNPAKVSADSKKMPAVSLSVKDKDEFYKVTKEVSKMKDNRIVIWLDFDETTDSFEKEQAACGTSESKCLSSAYVSQGFADDVIIQGNFTQDKVKNLVELINSGSLSTKLEEISSKTVDASFGANSLEKTFTAGAIGLVIVIVFMILMYRFSGFIASVGLVMYTFLTFLIFWLVGGVLTLPGIAATLLGIGMAVDANVINFARIKDELNNGRKFKDACRLGNKNSLLTIIDANTTTFIAAIILFIFGESSIKGFATMLMISIVTTMVVMVFLTRYISNLFSNSGVFDDKQKFFLGNTKKQFHFEKIRFAENEFKLLGLTAVIIIIGLVSLVTRGLNLGIDFSGGSSITVQSEEKLTEENITTDIKELNYTLESIDLLNENTASVVIDESLDKDEVLATEKYFTEKYEDSSVDIGVVSNIVKQELVKNAIYALVLAVIGIIVYVSIRYTFAYAVSGIVALVHDALIVVLLFSLLQLEVSTIFIAAILSIIGYSINDTIVLFDRIRENKKDVYKDNIKTKKELDDLLNLSIRQTINRNIITSFTTLIPVLCLIIFGSHEILTFNIAMFVGLIAGSYSSLFIAGYIWVIIEGRMLGKPKKDKKWFDDDEVEELKVKGVNS